MLQSPIVIGASAIYLALLFAVAYWGDKRADEGRSVIANPTIYALSMAVYCTTWTYYGSVGRAAEGSAGITDKVAASATNPAPATPADPFDVSNSTAMIVN